MHEHLLSLALGLLDMNFLLEFCEPQGGFLLMLPLSFQEFEVLGITQGTQLRLWQSPRMAGSRLRPGGW